MLLFSACKASRPPSPYEAEPPVVTATRSATQLVKSGDAVFFVGNSFFDWQNRPLHTWVAALGKQRSVELHTAADIVPGNEPLSKFLDHAAVREALSSRKYRVFVLQGEEYEAVDHKEAFHQAVRNFHQRISEAGAKTVLFMTWELRWRPFLHELATSYDEIGRELNIPVIPLGVIYKDCDRAPLKGEAEYWLLASPEEPKGDLHQNELGSVLNTYATFQMLTGLNPQGAPIGAIEIDPVLRRYLSDKAWARVYPRLEALR